MKKKLIEQVQNLISGKPPRPKQGSIVFFHDQDTKTFTTDGSDFVGYILKGAPFGFENGVKQYPDQYLRACAEAVRKLGIELIIFRERNV